MQNQQIKTFRKGGENTNIYAADLETTTKEPASCYLAGITNIFTPDLFLFTSQQGDVISLLLDCFFNLPNNSIVYFHNLKFDYSFIYPYLVKEKYVFEEIITGREKKIRQVTIFFSKNKKIFLRDSMPLFAPSTISLKKVLSSWCDKYLDKLTIDFYENMPASVSKEMIDYAKVDIYGLAEALNKRSVVGDGKLKLTTSSQAKAMNKEILNEKYKNINKNFFDNIAYPAITLEQDRYMRKFYQGGFVYLNPEYKEEIINNVYVYDVNSMYPSIMRDELLPMGKPRFFRGEPDKSKLYICKVFIKSLCLKEGGIPYIVRLGKSSYGSKEYHEDCENQTFFLTSLEIDMLDKCYYIKGLKYIEGFYFNTSKELFRDYIAIFNDMKENNIGAKREFAKLCLNAPSGKWGQNPNIETYRSELIGGIQRFVKNDNSDDKKTCFISSYKYIYYCLFTCKINKFYIKYR